MKILRKPISVLLLLAMFNLGFGQTVQAAWGQNFWQSLSANIFSLEDDELPEGLFFDWEATMPDNSVAIAFQNSEGLSQTFASLQESLKEKVTKATETEEGALLGFVATAYLEMLEGLSENLGKIESAEIFLQYDVEKIRDISAVYESSMELGLDPGALAPFEDLGLCVQFGLRGDPDLITAVSEDLQTDGEDSPSSFSMTKQEDFVSASIGCETDMPSLLSDLPAEVNLVAYQSGFDYEAFYAEDDSVEGLNALLMDFYQKIRGINAQKVAEDVLGGGFLLSLEPAGYKTQVVVSLKSTENANLLRSYWAGSELKQPFFMNEAALYEPTLLTFSGEGREYVFFEERFSGLDWTHWYGQIQAASMSLIPLVAVLGTITFAGVGGIAQDSFAEAGFDDPEFFVQNAAMAIKLNQVTAEEYLAPTNSEELAILLAEESGLSLPEAGKVCYYYIHSISQPQEFAFFASTNPLAVSGSDKMAAAIGKIFTDRPLGCEAPQIKGSLILSLSAAAEPLPEEKPAEPEALSGVPTSDSSAPVVIE